MTKRGMTLVEMMVATTATLILMAAVAQVFAVFGSALSDSRSMVELDARIRTVAARLRSDLAGATARPLPPLDPQAGEGYFEIIEGPLNDLSASVGTSNLAADTDDVLLFTTRNSDTPFLGRSGNSGGFVESTAAEVAWFLRPTVTDTTTTPPKYTSNPTTFTLYRRQLLVVGLAGFAPFSSNANTAPATSWSSFFEQYDISARVTTSGTVTPNTLSDLTRRESRFLHSRVTAAFPFPFVLHQDYPAPDGLVFTGASSSRVGEDVVLTNVLSFDVRVFDPVAPIDVVADAAVGPGDRGATGGTGSAASGAYVDLGNASPAGPSGLAPRFSGYGDPKAGTGANGLVGSATDRRTYDTWSTHYESNGIDEDKHPNAIDDDNDGTVDEPDENYGPDQGSDGLDNNNDGQVDEIAEQETSPPYPYPLRGVEVRIRCYEPASRQVRQVTVRHTFVSH
jgi:prepilin-type N-terminal cleavage/methylation domain-containing protein